MHEGELGSSFPDTQCMIPPNLRMFRAFAVLAKLDEQSTIQDEIFADFR